MNTTLYKNYPNLLGFERLFNELERGSNSYPPYNVVKDGEDDYTIEVAVAGFTKDDLTIQEHNGQLTISGKLQGHDEKNYIHKGVSGRSFERMFTLAEHMHVTDAVVENGLLSVKLVREVPEELKPRTIAIDFKG